MSGIDSWLKLLLVWLRPRGWLDTVNKAKVVKTVSISLFILCMCDGNSNNNNSSSTCTNACEREYLLLSEACLYLNIAGCRRFISPPRRYRSLLLLLQTSILVPFDDDGDDEVSFSYLTLQRRHHRVFTSASPSHAEYFAFTNLATRCCCR